MIMSNTLAVKVISLGKFTLFGGFWIYPLMYILNFLISDIYGYKNARRCTQTVIVASVFYIFVIVLLLNIPASEGWPHQQALNTLFSRQVRFYIAPLTGFSIAIFTSSYLLQKIKKKNARAVFICEGDAVISYFRDAGYSSILLYSILGFMAVFKNNRIYDNYIFAQVIIRSCFISSCY
ncbi:MAG: VUT family protein [Lentisphaerae bacterium]|nr:VUT family protein [Lentisphaerota bacterium]MCP4102716.1 VUT family protein [Lentisphaerota bacterium]